MAKINKKELKAAQNRNRVNFHRRLKFILKNENDSVDNVADRSNVNLNKRESNYGNQSNEKSASTERLRHWALEYNISKRAVSELLKILISLGMIWLPKDSRTLLSTPRYIEMKNLTNGKLWYVFFSLHNCLHVLNLDRRCLNLERCVCDCKNLHFVEFGIIFKVQWNRKKCEDDFRQFEVEFGIGSLHQCRWTPIIQQFKISVLANFGKFFW